MTKDSRVTITFVFDTPVDAKALRESFEDLAESFRTMEDSQNIYN